MKNPNNTGFFEEKPGVKSSERLKSFLMLLFFCGFVWGYLIYKGKDITTEFNFLAGLILIAAFTPTTLKKIAEIRSGIAPSPKTTVQESSSETSKTVTEQ